MTEHPPQLTTAEKPRNSGVTLTWVAAGFATFVIIGTMVVGMFMMREELEALQRQEPKPAQETVAALASLKAQLGQMQANHARQIESLQAKLDSYGEKEAGPDLSEELHALQAQLDSISMKMEQAAPIAAAPSPTVEIEEEVAEVAVPDSRFAVDFMKLQRAVVEGDPYAAELAAIAPQLPETLDDARVALEDHDTTGIKTEAALQRDYARLMAEKKPATSTSDLPGWARTLNARFGGMIKVEKQVQADAAPTEEGPLSLSEMTAAIDALPLNERAPFIGWQQAAQAHADVMNALADIDAAMMRE